MTFYRHFSTLITLMPKNVDKKPTPIMPVITLFLAQYLSQLMKKITCAKPYLLLLKIDKSSYFLITQKKTFKGPFATFYNFPFYIWPQNHSNNPKTQ